MLFTLSFYTPFLQFLHTIFKEVHPQIDFAKSQAVQFYTL